MFLPIAKRGTRHTFFRIEEAIADKPVMPVVRVSYLKFVRTFAQGRRNINFPWRAPGSAAINAIRKNPGDARWKRRKRKHKIGASGDLWA